MMAIGYCDAKLSADESLKNKAATSQMADLLSLLNEGRRHATLSVADREMLLEKGFAKDLVDNLIFYTERADDSVAHSEEDQLVVGFTHAAFDPSLYACDSVVDNLRETHDGRCAYCESPIDHTGVGCVSHFRPPWGVFDNGQWQRSSYFDLAYEQQNLLYSCHRCRDTYKGSLFPVTGARAPSVELENEQALLVNPYLDKPRDHIRFNPYNGQAYPFDKVCDFFESCLGIARNEVGDYLWKNPNDIPAEASMPDSAANAALQAQYLQWARAVEPMSHRGEVTIDSLGLNRQGLVSARQVSMLNLYSRYRLHELDHGSDDGQLFDALSNRVDPTASGLTEIDYPSCAVDAYNSWQCAKCDPTFWNDKYRQAIPASTASKQAKIMPWFASSLQYMVLDSELSLKGKRRIVCLHSSDFLYGSDRDVKTVFLPINWEQDFNNVIKVSSSKMIWESNFSELANTQPIALQSLFANNEVWAEGDYSALI